MAESDRIARLERQLADALAKIDRLTAVEAIRECIYRVCRGVDRIDEHLLRSAFHQDATLHFGSNYDGPVDDWIKAAMKFQAGQTQAHHMVGNIVIEIRADEAVAESYELARHKSPVGGEMRDLVLGMRTLDRLSRRHGQWKISERTKIIDWGRIVSADEAIYTNSFLKKGARDKSDLSYELLVGRS